MPATFMGYGSQPFECRITNNSAAGTSEVQTITPNTAPDAGTFTVTFYGFTTTAIAFGATAATIQTALEALPSIRTGNVSVSGTLATAIELTFQGELAETNLDAVTATSSLTAASVAVTLAIATTTAGVNTATAILPVIAGIRYEIDSLEIDPLATNGGPLRIGFGGNAQFSTVYSTTSVTQFKTDYPQPGNGGYYVGGIPFSYYIADMGPGSPDIWIRGTYHRVPTTNSALKYA